MPTIFDASAEDRKKKQEEVEAKLKRLQEESLAKKSEVNDSMTLSEFAQKTVSSTPSQNEMLSPNDFEESEIAEIIENPESEVEPKSKRNALKLEEFELNSGLETELNSETNSNLDLEIDSNSESEPESEIESETEIKTTNHSTEKKKNNVDKFKKIDRKPEDYSNFLREENSSNGLFSSFMVQPNGVCFESQHEEEIILLVLRQHWSVNITWIFFTFVLGLAPFVLFPMIPFHLVFPGAFMFFLIVAWYLFVAAYVIESFLGWYFNIYVITDERIIDIDFYSLIYKSVSEAKLERIEDVTSTTAGFFGAFFNYGNITIQTAAEKREFEFAKVPQPAKVTKFLNELILEEEREKIEGRVM